MDLSITSIKSLLVHILRRYHTVMFIVVIASGLIGVVFILNDILASSTQQVTPADTGLSQEFDPATIKRIEQLRTRDDKATQLDLSQGRSNPFVE